MTCGSAWKFFPFTIKNVCGRYTKLFPLAWLGLYYIRTKDSTMCKVFLLIDFVHCSYIVGIVCVTLQLVCSVQYVFVVLQYSRKWICHRASFPVLRCSDSIDYEDPCNALLSETGGVRCRMVIRPWWLTAHFFLVLAVYSWDPGKQHSICAPHYCISVWRSD